MSKKHQNDVSLNQDGGCQCRIFKGKNGAIKALAPKGIQEKKSNVIS